MKIPQQKLKLILEGSTNSKVLLLLDGYDEYKKGTNAEIDDAFSNTMGDCFIIITSRPGDYISTHDRDQMDGEIQIVGLSKENIHKCASNYLGSDAMANVLMKTGQVVGIHELFRIPIVLLAVCILYEEGESLPNSKTEIVWKIIRMCMDRSAIKRLGKKSSEIVDLDDMLCALGKLSWDAYQRGIKQLLINKINVSLLHNFCSTSMVGSYTVAKTIKIISNS